MQYCGVSMFCSINRTITMSYPSEFDVYDHDGLRRVTDNQSKSNRCITPENDQV